MTVNAKKSACLRFGPRYKNACSSVMVCGLPVNWVTSARYLGVRRIGKRRMSNTLQIEVVANV